MNNFICKKCGSTEYEIKDKANGTGIAHGLYCAKCGFWHKWLGKEELKQYKQKERKETNENKAEKSLRWVVNQIPDFEPKNNEEKMLLAIKLYCEAGAKEIAKLESENAALRERLSMAVELPLECGSAVWYLNTHKSISLNENTVYEGILERYHLAPIGGKLYFIVDIRIKNDYGITVLPEVEKDYGKTWFTSRKAAEARLAELKGDK